MKNIKSSEKFKTLFMAISVAMVLFSAHAGGGFATGNQANTYFVSLGWPGIFSALLAMFLLTRTMAEAMKMYRNHNFSSHKELFEYLYFPFGRFAFLYDIFFYFIVLMAIAATLSGAASALQKYLPLNYFLYVLIVGAIILIFTIFGSDRVRRLSTFMGIVILISAIAIYLIGIFTSPNTIKIFDRNLISKELVNIPKAIINGFVYAGFQCVTLPTMIICGKVLKDEKQIMRSMNFSFVINATALVLSVIMLSMWKDFYLQVENGSTLPTLFITEQLGWKFLFIPYGICLILCLISTGVTITFGFISRFENAKILSSIENTILKRALIAIFIIILSMIISTLGLTNIIKYGYGYCGYLSIAVVIIPMLTVGVYKNRNFGRFKLKTANDNI